MERAMPCQGLPCMCSLLGSLCSISINQTVMIPKTGYHNLGPPSSVPLGSGCLSPLIRGTTSSTIGAWRGHSGWGKGRHGTFEPLAFLAHLFDLLDLTCSLPPYSFLFPPSLSSYFFPPSSFLLLSSSSLSCPSIFPGSSLQASKDKEDLSVCALAVWRWPQAF